MLPLPSRLKGLAAAVAAGYSLSGFITSSGNEFSNAVSRGATCNERSPSLLCSAARDIPRVNGLLLLLAPSLYSPMWPLENGQK